LDDACALQEERDVLSAIPYNENDVYLHTDASLMPANQGTWSSWNFLGSSADEASTKAVCVSYWLNRLQHLPAHLPELFCTLNPLHPPAEDKASADPPPCTSFYGKLWNNHRSHTDN
jgi:predicted NAD/FAD-binding protein